MQEREEGKQKGESCVKVAHDGELAYGAGWFERTSFRKNFDQAHAVIAESV